MARSADSEAGGVADLQTDVMRFMAILAICLVAIFALVQSIPLKTAPAEPVATEPVRAASPVPEPKPEPEPEPDIVVVTKPAPVPTPPSEPALAPTPAPQSQNAGFTLQFEDNLALTRLTARNEVGLYAIGEEKSLRMSVNRGRLSFWPASTPNEFFEMEASTVPDDVLLALRRSSPNGAENVQWGVTLPARMQDQLNGFLESADGGELFIGADGQLRLEP
jgi:hypothetical protein